MNRSGAFFQYEPDYREGANRYYKRYYAFLTALFVETLWVMKTSGKSIRKEAATWIREYMTKGMTFSDHGQNRANFAKAVVATADALVRLTVSHSL
jgi:hypothetical protein